MARILSTAVQQCQSQSQLSSFGGRRRNNPLRVGMKSRRRCGSASNLLSSRLAQTTQSQNNDYSVGGRRRNNLLRIGARSMQRWNSNSNISTVRPRPIVLQQDGRRVVPLFLPNYLLKGRFRIQEMIGSGGFGQIFRAIEKTKGYCVAVKVCDAVGEGKRLIIEQKVMNNLNGTDNSPFLVFSGPLRLSRRKNQIHFIVMELLGQNLTALRKASASERFSVGTALRVGEQCVTALQKIHEIGYLHRDVKPANMCVGLMQWNRQHTVFLIDFGLARKFLQPDGTTRAWRPTVGFRGTPRYVSLNVHARKEVGPVDDLWSLYYSVIELVEGQLPWRGLSKNKEIGMAKMKAKFRELSIRIPSKFSHFELYLRTLNWDDRPDYDQLRYVLRSCWPTGITEETPFEWETSASRRRSVRA